MNSILAWQNEHGFEAYPLTNEFTLKNLIVDASFIQFDNFVPELLTVTVKGDRVVFQILFDLGLLTVEVLDTHQISTAHRIYEGGRYLGCLTLGAGLLEAIQSYPNRSFAISNKFLPHTVRSISKQAGVYTLQGAKGAIHFTSTDHTIRMPVVSNVITWTAIAASETTEVEINTLKTINGIAPLNNNLRIVDNDFIKVTPGIGSLTFSLANSALNDNISPAKRYTS